MVLGRDGDGEKQRDREHGRGAARQQSQWGHGQGGSPALLPLREGCGEGEAKARELQLPWVGEPCPSAACVWPLRPVTNGPAQPVPAPAAGGFHPRQECQLNFDFLGVAYPRAQL